MKLKKEWCHCRQENVHQQGLMSEEERDRLIKEQLDREAQLERAREARHNAQLASFKQRMADRKKRRLDALCQKHEQDKMEVR